jgi:release factor glutamine methyltransferase
VRDYEPPVALYGGSDGLRIVSSLLRQSVERLKPDGWLLFEFGAGQDEEVRQLISETSGLTMSEMRSDLRGIPRVAVAQAGRKA